MKRDTREEARRLRRQGMSVRYIASAVGASKGSVSVWVRDIQLTEAQKLDLKRNQTRWGPQNTGAQSNHNRYLEKRVVYQEAGRVKAREARPLHMMGCMLYWAEGAKGRNRLYFVNSDPNMMCLFMSFLREELNTQNGDITINIHCHHLEQIEYAEQYWLELLKLPTSCLRKTQIKQGSSTRHNILEYGICGISIHKTELVQHIYGAIQEYGGFDNPEWLF